MSIYTLARARVEDCACTELRVHELYGTLCGSFHAQVRAARARKRLISDKSGGPITRAFELGCMLSCVFVSYAEL